MAESTSSPTPPVLETSFDPRTRRLCPDGTCIGLIGADGHCKECGLFSPEGARGLGPEAFGGGCAVEDDDVDGMFGGADEARADADEQAGGPGFDPKRALCPDGACVGVIGADGRCGECGRAAPAEGPG